MSEENRVECECGKLLGKWRDGKLYVKCRNCDKEIEIEMLPKTE